MKLNLKNYSSIQIHVLYFAYLFRTEIEIAITSQYLFESVSDLKKCQAMTFFLELIQCS